MINNFFRTYLLPGITFQSIVVSGGYCTGQEIVQYFLSLGLTNGWYGLLVTTFVWSVICILCFVLARAYQAYDYKSFFKILLGRGWFLFEICYLYTVLIALSVIAASVGSLLEDLLGVPYQLGLIIPFTYIIWMLIKGTQAIEKMFSLWSLLLYSVFIIFVFCCYRHADSNLWSQISAAPTGLGWLKNGITYASYNVCCVPAILFTLRYFKTNKQAVIAGLIAGPMASIPGILLFFVLATEYPQVLSKTVPATYLLDKQALPLLTLAFSIVLIGTLIETGVGLVHAFKQRLNVNAKPTPLQIAALMSVLLGAYGLSQFGLVRLIVQGYGLLTWFTLAVFILPLLTYGLIKIKHSIRCEAVLKVGSHMA